MKIIIYRDVEGLRNQQELRRHWGFSTARNYCHPDSWKSKGRKQDDEGPVRARAVEEGCLTGVVRNHVPARTEVGKRGSRESKHPNLFLLPTFNPPPHRSLSNPKPKQWSPGCVVHRGKPPRAEQGSKWIWSEGAWRLITTRCFHWLYGHCAVVANQGEGCPVERLKREPTCMKTAVSNPNLIQISDSETILSDNIVQNWNPNRNLRNVGRTAQSSPLLSYLTSQQSFVVYKAHSHTTSSLKNHTLK